jgi:hypothetical protein
MVTYWYFGPAAADSKMAQVTDPARPKQSALPLTLTLAEHGAETLSRAASARPSPV